MILQANKQKAGQLRPLKLPAVGLRLWEVIVEHKLLRSQTFPLCGPANMQKVKTYSNVLKVLRCGPVVYQRQVLCEQVKPVCKALTYYPKQHAVSLYLMIMSKCPDYKVSKPFSPLQKRSRSSYQPVFLDWISSNQFWVRLETRWGLDLNPRASWGLPLNERVPLSVISVISDAERTSRSKWTNAETAQPDWVCDFIQLHPTTFPTAGQTADRTDYPTCQQLVYLQQQQSW